MPETLTATLIELVGELERRFPYAAAVLSGTSGIQIQDSGDEQHAAQVNPSRGVVFTVYDGHAFFELARGDLAVDGLVRAVRAWAGQLRPRTDGPPLAAGASIAPDAIEATFQVPMERNPARVPLAEKLALARALQRHARQLDPRIAQARVGYGDRAEDSIYIGRGRHLEQRITRTILTLYIATVEQDRVAWHFLSHGGTGGFELARMTEEDQAHTAEIAVRLLGAAKIMPGEYDVVTDPSVSGVIAHECFGHGVELDLFPIGRARAARYLGKRVAAPGVAMFDDPGVPGAYGSYFFDDEGELARPTQILRDGILVLPISDLTSATFTPGMRTANGRRQDFTRKAYARMSNTFFAAGPTAPTAMLDSLEDGIYLRQAESGMEDPMGWGIQVTAHYGEEYRAGKPTGRLFSPIGISGYVPDLLHSISTVGDDLRLDPGVCGKGHKEMVDVSSGGPHLRMKARLG